MTCDEDHCITCSDEASPMRVVEVASSGIALCVTESGATSDVMVDLVGPVAVGDTILVHAGTALALVGPAT